MPSNLYEALWIFLIYAFIGWCVEVAYAALNKGVFVNRGFLNGPYCPIYGCGMLVVAVLLTPLTESIFPLFLGSMVLTTVLEYFTGLILEKVFGNKWWDYSDVPFNIQGYVCLKFSVLWGLGGTFVIKILHPLIYKGILWIPKTLGYLLLMVITTAFVVDVCVTVNTILKFNRKIKNLQRIADVMHKLSDEIGEDIFEKVSSVRNKSEGMQEGLAEKIEQAEALKEEYRTMLESRHFGFRRITKAFPDMKRKNRNEILQEYKKFLAKRKE